MQTSDLTILSGDSESMKSKEKPLEIEFGDDFISDTLDFHAINKMAKEVQRKNSGNKASKVLTTSEKKAIPLYIKDMSSYIKKYAAQGKFKFEYDCSKLTDVCFEELGQQFKQKNPLFFIVMQYGTQILTVEWTGKNEV